MKKKKQIIELVVYLLIFIALLFSFYGVIYLFNNSFNNNSNDNDTKKVEIKNKDKEEEKEEEVYVEPYVNNLPTYRNNYGNQNIMGMLQIPGLFDEMLITRASDNDYYLNRNLWNVYDGIGAPFFDFRNTDLDNARQINVYGHNSQNTAILDKLPLSKLISYLDSNFFNTYKDVYLYTDTQKIQYEVIAVKVIQKTNNYHMALSFYDDNDFVDHTNNLLSGSTNLRDTKINKKDKLLVLQTCNYNPENTLVLVICKTVK